MNQRKHTLHILSILVVAASLIVLPNASGSALAQTVQSAPQSSSPVSTPAPPATAPNAVAPIQSPSPPSGGPPDGRVTAPGISSGSSPSSGQAAGPTPNPPSALSSAVREKETKETKETKEIKDRPSDFVEIISAIAWPSAIFLIIASFFLLLAFNRAIQQLFGIAASAVQKIEIAGVKLEIDTSAVNEVKRFMHGSLRELVEKAAAQYEKTVAAASVDDRLSQVARDALRDVLQRHGLGVRPASLRATIHVPDIVFKDYMYQLVNYYPRSASRSKTVGRRLSQRFGIVGRAWRLRQSIGRGKAISGPDASEQLISSWGMQQEEADDQSHLLRPASLCVMLIDAQDGNNRVGLLYVDSTEADAFGINPPLSAPTAIREAAAAAALQTAEAIAKAATDAAAQQTADPIGQAAARQVALAASTAVTQAAGDAARQAVSHEAAEAAVTAATHRAADLVTRAASDASAQATSAVAAHAASITVQAAIDAKSNAIAQSVAFAMTSVVVAPAATADQIASALQDHSLTRALARAVNQAMAPLRGAGPALDITDLKYDGDNA